MQCLVPDVYHPGSGLRIIGDQRIMSGRHQGTDSNSRTLVTGSKAKAPSSLGSSAFRTVEGYGYTSEDQMMSRAPLRILAFAYACELGQGSEPGARWAWSRMLAWLGEAWVITRRDDQAATELLAEALPRPPVAARAADLR